MTRVAIKQASATRFPCVNKSLLRIRKLGFSSDFKELSLKVFGALKSSGDSKLKEVLSDLDPERDLGKLIDRVKYKQI